jgi:xanthine dehydrogenase accessory factor
VRGRLDDLDRWRREGKRTALARVVAVDGSAPRDAGAAMAVSETGEVAGSISGGCIEAAVVAAALESLATNRPTVHDFGYADDDAVEIGLTCGGTIQVFIQPHDPTAESFIELTKALGEGTPVALATLVTGQRPGASLFCRADHRVLGTLGDAALDAAVSRDAIGLLVAGTAALRHYECAGDLPRSDVAIFIESFTSAPKMIIFGAVDFSAALAQAAQLLGFRVTVCDARPTFLTRARFPTADKLVVDWPHRHLAEVGSDLTSRDAVCVLTHDTKFDVPAILAALDTDVGYLGAMGSRRTHEGRLTRLLAGGATTQSLERLRSPIGLDLGARTPEETAVSICAEIIALRSDRTLIEPLSSGDGPIHG